MPAVQGKLSTITNQPSRIKEVWLRPAATRPGDGELIVDEPVRITVDEHGEFTATIALGAAVLVLIGTDFMARESIPLLIHEGTATIRQAVEDAKDFTPDVHDRLAELADQVARGVKSTGEAVKSVAADREKVEAAAEAVEASSAAAKAAEASVSSAWQQVKARLAQWEERVQQLDRWQPQYEWLKEHAETSFAVVQEKITQATQQIVSQVRSDAEAVRRDAATAGQHSLKAQAAAKSAESAVQRVVDAAIAKLKGNAPEMLDTLEELAERVKAGGTLEAEIIQKLSKMADSETVKQLKTRLDSLSIDGVRGLAEALAGKASSSHTHNKGEITGLEADLTKVSQLEEKYSTIETEIGKKAGKDEIAGMATKSEVQKLQDAVNAAPKIQVVSSMPRHPDHNTIYVVR
ncbi:hypothetical protein I4J42_09940 [Corynebacterium belfantii]|uniref:hypothetical protein n=1 Tax=Corynebacterium belfantii TaxID=2014537 RepID=UPI0018D445E8|nr:hypothetical protein [Corynebacterium belfantii]MBG9334121.1 hypothetical protein [Corynebacterium belfantii]